MELQIESVWRAEQEILDVVHSICVANNLRYTLAYGTLLGAVRHGGFIPWDDDIDLMMPREDYEKLLSIWDEVAPKEYILQNNKINLDFTQNFTKIRKNNTTFIQSEDERNKTYHKGIFVDIFPGDRVALGTFSRKLQYVACAFNLLYSRGYSSGSGGMVGIIEKILLSVPRKFYPQIRNSADKFIQKWNKKQRGMYVFPCTINASRHYYPEDLFENMQMIEFCGKDYCCVKNIDSTLKSVYGDYMQLPPEEERVWKHHPILIDFEHNYEDLVQV